MQCWKTLGVQSLQVAIESIGPQSQLRLALPVHGTWFTKVQGFLKEYNIMGKPLGKESAELSSITTSKSLCNFRYVIWLLWDSFSRILKMIDGVRVVGF